MNTPLDLEDIFNNPHKYGAPTLEEFAKDPKKWRISDTFQLDSAANGPKALRNMIRRVIYEIDGFECSTLEELEKVALNQGYLVQDLVMKPELEQEGINGKLNIRVKFHSVSRLKLMEGLT